MYCIARPCEGISLNGDEYARFPGETERAKFRTPTEAEFALMYYGYDEERMKAEGVHIVEIDDEEPE